MKVGRGKTWSEGVCPFDELGAGKSDALRQAMNLNSVIEPQGTQRAQRENLVAGTISPFTREVKVSAGMQTQKVCALCS